MQPFDRWELDVRDVMGDDDMAVAVVELVAKEFAIKQADVVVASGATSRQKRLQLTGVDVRAAERIVDRLLAPAGPGGARH